MHGAPPVALVCDGGKVWRGVCAGLPALAAAALGAWLAGHAGLAPTAQTLAALAAALFAACVAWFVVVPQRRSLAWDGEHWRLGPAGDAGHVSVMIDLGGWLLLRHTGHGEHAASTWLAVSDRSVGAALHGLRVALQAHATAAPTGIDSPERQAR